MGEQEGLIEEEIVRTVLYSTEGEEVAPLPYGGGLSFLLISSAKYYIS